MLEKKWNNIAPEVPQDFHNKFEDTLKQIEQADSVDKKYKRKKISGRLLIASAVICTGMLSLWLQKSSLNGVITW